MAESIEALERRLKGYDEQIDRLEHELDQNPNGRLAGLEHDLSALRDRHREAEEHLARLRLEKAESWADEDIQEGIFRIFDDIGKRIDRLFGSGKAG